MTKTMRRCFYLLLVSIVLSNRTSLAFVPLVSVDCRRQRCDRCRFAVHKELQDLEDARSELESMMGPLIYESKRPSSSVVLTEASRKRREVEMELLQSLEGSDDAVDELMSLWLTEKDATSAQALLAMQTECSSTAQQEEVVLREMVEEYGYQWPEPMNRLALLLFLKGDLDASEELLMRVLHVKPWHFEAVQLELLISLVRKDMSSALYWARRGLPPLNPSTNHKKRKAWVARSLQEAREALRQLQEERFRLSSIDATSSQDVAREPSWQ